MSSQRRRVVVTGMGTLNPLGLNVKDSWSALLDGRSGLAPLTIFDHSRHKVHIGGEVKDFDPQKVLDKRLARRLDRFTQFAVAAANEAIADAELDFSKEDTARIGVVVGTGLIGMPEIEAQKVRLEEKGPNQVMPLLVPKMMGNAPAAQIAIAHKLRGPNFCVVTACAAGGNSLGSALRLLQYGEADVMLAGATEAAITPLVTAGFSNMGALAVWPGPPETASRPFDKERCGFVIAEGAGVMVLEDLEHAQKRGARIYAEFCGYGLSGDGNHITAPCEDGDGGRRAMMGALKDAGLNPEAIDYINAHGTSTATNDRVETIAIKSAFGAHAQRVPISSSKSMTGHMLAAAGGFEAIVTVLSVAEDKIHPTINLTTPDPDCDLDYVAEGTREVPVRAAISNSLGFGGHNAVLAFKKF